MQITYNLCDDDDALDYNTINLGKHNQKNPQKAFGGCWQIHIGDILNDLFFDKMFVYPNKYKVYPVI